MSVSEALPVYGSMSVVGRAREMEDEISVKMNLCKPEINGYKPVHFFGVFDGHGGHHVNHASFHMLNLPKYLWFSSPETLNFLTRV